MGGMFSKKCSASSTVMSRMSETVLPRYVTWSVSRLYRAPLQTSHGT